MAVTKEQIKALDEALGKIRKDLLEVQQLVWNLADEPEEHPTVTELKKELSEEQIIAKHDEAMEEVRLAKERAEKKARQQTMQHYGIRFDPETTETWKKGSRLIAEEAKRFQEESKQAQDAHFGRMGTPHKCQVCNGAGWFGEYPKELHEHLNQPHTKCHACEGKGVPWG